MKRDMDLCRLILLRAEGAASFNLHKAIVEPLLQEGRTQEEVDYHLLLLCEAGLLAFFADRMEYGPAANYEGRNLGLRKIEASQTVEFIYGIGRSTWAGHEFLDASRSDTLWAKAKKMLSDKIGSHSI